MSVTQLHESPAGTQYYPGELSVERTGVQFFNASPGRLSLEVTFCNRGPGRSETTTALIGSAPLGAFVSWRPLVAARVPALDPGASFVFRHEVAYRDAASLGGPGRVPPRTLLTAIGGSDPQGPRPNLAIDILRLVGRGSTHWAGNLNVFVGNREVERHMAQALRVCAGRTNAAMFVVGHGRPDGYRFKLRGNASGWDVRLVDITGAATIVAGASDDRIVESEWQEATLGLYLLAFDPPADVTSGTIEVHVRQRSTGKTALVEFALDAHAAGPGCFQL